ncbi:MAG TPA: beta-L-arabinofuranosidase domain-containing protein, partial [Vicinamibacterales bacterium]
MKTFLAAAAIVLVFVAAHAAQYPGPMKVADKIILKAIPFALQDVRLLDGPFRDAMIRDQQYLLSLDQDRLLHNFRVTAGLPSTAQPLGGWEAPDVELRGHAVGHYLSAVSIMYASTGDERFKQRADSLVAEFAKVQAAESEKFHP